MYTTEYNFKVAPDYTAVAAQFTLQLDLGMGTVYRTVGEKQYELKDHLGNVRVVVNDRKDLNTETDELSAHVVAYNNYYPFGMPQPNRNFDSQEYRYGFQGQEKDSELKGEGLFQNYKFRMYDPRIGRFFAVDPLSMDYPDYSPYSFAGNKVIAHRELEGLEEMVAIINQEIGQPQIFAVTGQQMFMMAASHSSEIGSAAANRKSYKKAFANLKEGWLVTNTGKMYSNPDKVRNVKVYLIDGSVVEASIAQNIGNRNGNGLLNTTKGMNQVELMRPSGMVTAEFALKASGVVLDVVSWVGSDGELNASNVLSSSISEGAVAMSGAKGIKGGLVTLIVDALLMTADYDARKNKLEQDIQILNSIFNGRTSLNDAQNILNNYDDPLKFLPLSSNSLDKFISGEITDFQKLREYDYDSGYSGETGGGILYFDDVDKDQIKVHAIYLPAKIGKDDE